MLEPVLEAGRIDGASERRIFFSIIVPQILPTIVTVFVTVLIGAMKVGDLVFAFGANSYDADVIGSRFITELWTNADLGKASAMTGEYDGGVPTAFVQATVMQWLPNAELHVMSNSGHYPMQETPIQFVTVCEAFLGRFA